jgi:3-oxoacyl-[acyl-carrier protein] reductase
VILSSKNILVFAATGAIGSGVARKFAKEGAHVWISGRNQNALDKLVSQIESEGGTATAEVVDATDSKAVIDYVDRVAKEVGSIDAVFNAIGGRPVDLGYPESSITQDFDRFMKPLQVILGSTFLTARAAGKRMVQQGNGSILTLSATLTGSTFGNMAGISAACGAIEAMTRSLAGEFGSSGVRVNCLRASAMPETRTIQETGAGLRRIKGETQPVESVESSPKMPPLGRFITVEDTAATATFLVSDQSSGMTGQVVTVCAGAFVG